MALVRTVAAYTLPLQGKDATHEGPAARLGVTLDKYLGWDSHVLTRKKYNGALFRLSTCATRPLLSFRVGARIGQRERPRAAEQAERSAGRAGRRECRRRVIVESETSAGQGEEDSGTGKEEEYGTGSRVEDILETVYKI